MVFGGLILLALIRVTGNLATIVARDWSASKWVCPASGPDKQCSNSFVLVTDSKSPGATANVNGAVTGNLYGHPWQQVKHPIFHCQCKH